MPDGSFRCPRIGPHTSHFLFFFHLGPTSLGGPQLQRYSLHWLSRRLSEKSKNSQWSPTPIVFHVYDPNTITSSRASTLSPLCGPCYQRATRVEGSLSRECRGEERRNAWSPPFSPLLRGSFSLSHLLWSPASAGQPELAARTGRRWCHKTNPSGTLAGMTWAARSNSRGVLRYIFRSTPTSCTFVVGGWVSFYMHVCFVSFGCGFRYVIIRTEFHITHEWWHVLVTFFFYFLNGWCCVLGVIMFFWWCSFKNHFSSSLLIRLWFCGTTLLHQSMGVKHM